MDNSNLEKRKERFKTVASRRVQKVLDSMDNLSKCSNRRNYEYSEEDVQKMLKVINNKIALLKAAYTAGLKSGKQNFKF